jgi:multidrug efflux pump subunit AcrA (membrane-fusion protein)
MLLLTSCARPTPPVTHAGPATDGGTTTASVKREIRLTGIVEAVHSSKVQVPQIFGPGGPLTLTRLIPNGSAVKEGDLIATFDATMQIDAARDAQAKYDDLGHQAEQKRAQNRADAEKRLVDLRQAEADLAKAELEMKKGPILSDIERQQNEVKADIARKHVESLKKSIAFHEKSDAASLRILELQRDRQKVALERAQTNIAKLEIHAQLAGMVAVLNVFRPNSQGKPQEGDQLFRGQGLVSIFDPSEMAVRCSVGEPDGAALIAGAPATVYLDAYPELKLPAHVEFVSPVASSNFGSPIKTFTAKFKLDKSDPHLMPDLSAAVVIDPLPQSVATAVSGGGK